MCRVGRQTLHTHSLTRRRGAARLLDSIGSSTLQLPVKIHPPSSAAFIATDLYMCILYEKCMRLASPTAANRVYAPVPPIDQLLSFVFYLVTFHPGC